MEVILRNFHRDMWRWLAEHPMNLKSHWPGWQAPVVQELVDKSNLLRETRCFACVTAKMNFPHSYMSSAECADYCPIHWGTDAVGHKVHCLADGTAYVAWKSSYRDPHENRRAALWIADAWDNPSEWRNDDAQET